MVVAQHEGVEVRGGPDAEEGEARVGVGFRERGVGCSEGGDGDAGVGDFGEGGHVEDGAVVDEEVERGIRGGGGGAGVWGRDGLAAGVIGVGGADDAFFVYWEGVSFLFWMEVCRNGRCE